MAHLGVIDVSESMKAMTLCAEVRGVKLAKRRLAMARPFFVVACLIAGFAGYRIEERDDGIYV